MDFSLMNDDEILKELGTRMEKMRQKKELSDAELSKKGGNTKDALARFKNGEPITTKNLVKIIRGLGELRRLEQLFGVEDEFRPSQGRAQPLPKRIRNKKTKSGGFKWGEDN